jgi:hypothetical protein
MVIPRKGRGSNPQVLSILAAAAKITSQRMPVGVHPPERWQQETAPGSSLPGAHLSLILSLRLSKMLRRMQMELQFKQLGCGFESRRVHHLRARRLSGKANFHRSLSSQHRITPANAGGTPRLEHLSQGRRSRVRLPPLMKIRRSSVSSHQSLSRGLKTK